MTVIRQWIEQRALQQGSSVYLEDASQASTMTYSELLRSASAWARLLTEAGIKPGARVAVRLPDPVGYAAALLGVGAAGRGAGPPDPPAPAPPTAPAVAGGHPP